MATYTITVNERAKAGKSLVNYLRNLGVIDEPNEETIEAIKEARCGENLEQLDLDKFDEFVASL